MHTCTKHALDAILAHTFAISMVPVIAFLKYLKKKVFRGGGGGGGLISVYRLA